MERSYFFDSVAGDQRIYQAADFARFHAQIIGNGVSNTPNLPDLSVSAKQNMVTTLGAGYAFANGYMYENSTALDLQHAIADPTNDRIDRVVIRFDSDPANRTVSAVVKQGTPAANPTPPNLQRDNYVYELSVAQVRIIAGKSFIEQSQVTDERADQSVCGYIPLHNLVRGVQVNEDGIATMPNQSYVEVDSEQPVEIIGGEGLSVLPIIPSVDRQNEVQGNSFVPKTSGVYFIFAYVSFVEGDLPDGADLQISFSINGSYETAIAARASNGTYDNIFVGSSSTYLNAGDSLIFNAEIRNKAGQTINTRNHRLRIAKSF